MSPKKAKARYRTVWISDLHPLSSLHGDRDPAEKELEEALP